MSESSIAACPARVKITPCGNSRRRWPGVYAMENTITGKIYVGSSARMARRCHDHLHSLALRQHANPTMQADYDQHGAASFRFYVLEECTADLRTREQHWIDELDSDFTGYNIRCSQWQAATPERSHAVWAKVFGG